ncbi:MAG: hypothetical protein V1649_00975 [Patescibacteria group bacterium]
MKNLPKFENCSKSLLSNKSNGSDNLRIINMNQISIIYKQTHKVFLAVVFFALIMAPTVLAAPYDVPNAPTSIDNAATGLTATAKQGYGSNKYNTDVPKTIGQVVGAALAFVGIVFLILMIYGGLVWMFAQGNEQEVTKAKSLIFSAIIGLIIVLGAYAITAYVGSVVGQT